MSHVSQSPVSEISRKRLPPSYAAVPQSPGHPSEQKNEGQPATAQTSDAGAKWVIGWKTPIVMITFYVLALLFSTTHLVMLIILNNKPVANYHQSYITTASTILASFFGLSLNTALGTAFAQILWSILRKSAHKLQTIEDLFTMRTIPYLAMRGMILQSAPLLSLFVAVLWSLQVVINFPPGALTVISQPHATINATQVMALNTSYIGKGDATDLQNTAIAALTAEGQGNVITSVERRTVISAIHPTVDHRGSVMRLAAHTMISGAITTAPSPCGLNYTYLLQFAGPYMLCDSPQNSTATIVPMGDTVPLFFAGWSNPLDDKIVQYLPEVALDRRAESTSVAEFNVTLFAPLGMGGDNEDVYVQISFLQCRPGQATYNINVTYQDGEQNFDVQTDPQSIRVLTDVTKPAPIQNCTTGCDCCGASQCNCGPAVEWSDASLQWLSDTNNMAIIESMTLALAGQYNVVMLTSTETQETPFNYTLANGSNITLTPFTIDDEDYDSVGVSGQATAIENSGPNNTIIGSTLLNLHVNDYNINDGPELVVTQDKLNEILQNITISLMNNFPLGQPKSSQQKANSETLGVALPLLAIGALSLYQNGVSATDGGFLQILTTTSTSDALHRVASGGALGGDENVPEELKELKVRYGELIGGERELKGVRRRTVGFGVEDEVVPIQKGVGYGGQSGSRKSTGSVESAETGVLL